MYDGRKHEYEQGNSNCSMPSSSWPGDERKVPAFQPLWSSPDRGPDTCSGGRALLSIGWELFVHFLKIICFKGCWSIIIAFNCHVQQRIPLPLLLSPFHMKKEGHWDYILVECAGQNRFWRNPFKTSSQQKMKQPSIIVLPLVSYENRTGLISSVTFCFSLENIYSYF